MLYQQILTFSVTMLLLPLRSSGAIHGNVPRTPPDTKVCCFTFDNPRSPIYIQIQSEEQKIQYKCSIRKVTKKQKRLWYHFVTVTPTPTKRKWQRDNHIYSEH